MVKICGLANGADVQAVAALRPDALGFVFWSGSKRCVRPADVAAWTRELPPGLLKVGVFVNAPPEELEAAVREAGLDVVQYGFFQSLEKKPEIFPNIGKIIREFSKHWKTLHLDREAPGPGEAAFVDAFLVDSYSADSPGGTGRVGDWAAARAFVERCGKPVVLAGGLTPENVAEAIRTVRPWGVDVSSGVELSPGRKDLKKAEEFIRACRENA